MTKDIQKTVLKVLAQTAPEIELDQLNPDRVFRDQWDFDSVDHLNFILGLQKEWNVVIPETDYPRCSSLNGCVAYFREHFGIRNETSC